jgi:hypothetical protein
MSNVGYDTWWKKECPTVFIVKNIAGEGKRIRVFDYPIANGMERDLMMIPYVSEADIKHSLLKGVLFYKLKHGEIYITDSNIDLIQFDDCQKAFLMAHGVTKGLTAGTGSINYIVKEGMILNGSVDGSNRIFTTNDKFIDGAYDNNQFAISVFHNGRKLVKNIDFITAESGGPGSGYDTVIFLQITPAARSVIRADYTIKVV